MDKLDILNRSEFVRQLLRLIENISTNKGTTCFAINGSWGCGKSFVLDLLEEQLTKIQSEETCDDKYFVVRYNCWKYDYYEEPLVAIVSQIIAEIERKTLLFSNNEETQKILGMFKAAGVSLMSLANSAIKAQTGIDFQKAYEIAVNGKKEGAEKYEKDHDYDTYLGLNKVIDKLSTFIQRIAGTYTVVFIVDELDRCIPEYAIKVLERLHHLTEEKSNIITIIAIDKLQLVASVKKLFGFENPEKYFDKFINFEIRLDNGSISEGIMEKYSDYIALFNKDIFSFEDSVEECIQALFKGIDIRTQEQLVKKAMVAHKLLYSEPKDYSFMCMELLLVVMISVYKYQGLFDNTSFNMSSLDSVFLPIGKDTILAFSDFFKEKFESLHLRRSDLFAEETINYILPSYSSLYGALLFTWCWLHNERSVSIKHMSGDVYTIISNNHKELIKFAETINLM